MGVRILTEEQGRQENRWSQENSKEARAHGRKNASGEENLTKVNHQTAHSSQENTENNFEEETIPYTTGSKIF